MKQQYRSFLSFGLKILFGILAIYYLYNQTDLLKTLWHLFDNLSGSILVLMLIFSVLNWIFEIKKWQVLVANVQKISFYESYKQSLISFAVSLTTPNRIGEWGAKVLFYPSALRQKIFSLSLIGSMSQMFTSLFFGLAGIFLSYFYDPEFWQRLHFFHNKLFLIFMVLIVLSAAFFRFKIHFKTLFFETKIWSRAFLYAFVRYFIFSTQFLILLLYFHKESNWIVLLTGIYLTYFISTLIPMLSLLDWAVKSGVAVWVFQSVLPANIVLKSIAIMWVFNFLIPFFIGSVYFYRHKFFTGKG